jgi:NADH:ubiquinone oxidoreductase subunit E
MQNTYLGALNSAALPAEKDRILTLFHRVQNARADTNDIPPEAVRDIARHLNMSVAEVYGVLSFYHLFSVSPRGRYVIRLCDSLSCRVAGSIDIYSHLSRELGIKRGETTGDGLFTLEIVNCLGSCDTAPNMMVNNQLIGNLTISMLDEYIAMLMKEASDEKA